MNFSLIRPVTSIKIILKSRDSKNVMESHKIQAQFERLEKKYFDYFFNMVVIFVQILQVNYLQQTKILESFIFKGTVNLTQNIKVNLRLIETVINRVLLIYQKTIQRRIQYISNLICNHKNNCRIIENNHQVCENYKLINYEKITININDCTFYWNFTRKISL